MSKVDVYIGGYLLFDEVTQEESGRLASNLCVIGMPLTITYVNDSDRFVVSVPTGETIGTIRPKNKLAMRSALEDGWTCKAWLSLVYYNNDTKLFGGELVYQFYHVKTSQVAEQAALDNYAQRTSERLAAGNRPDVVLTGTAYDTIIETGDWNDNSKQALLIDTSRSSGTVVFKRKKGFADKLAAGAIEHNPGCRVALIIAALILIAIIVIIVISCTSNQ
ncbi:MAG: hypothetical protein IKE43_04550 [Coriobacteriales bacterium]|nr:hypothetical protein [Coriobacteriales bacterium]